MTQRSRVSSRSLAIAGAMAAGLVAPLALAHPGHGVEHGGLAAGLMHPWLGLDHLLAMAAIGLWSLGQGAAMRRFTPLMALAGMLAGAGLALSGALPAGALPGVEGGIALSVLIAGVMVAALMRLPAALGGGLVIALMTMHGIAHGAEMPAAASLVAYVVGFSASTLAITMLARVLGGWLASREQRLVRALGAAIAVCGGVLALS
ncbi:MULTISPECIES: HupE/UreJ family protein [Halomonas]|jgi:urease accessory protein|uniref:HupE/UreJ family protein n=2 Tax=Halomonas TaxID=2745 RepID=A0AAU7KD28_9GAMM|nr:MULTISPECIES: HupE/UreJ family protein [Halomonas]MBY5941064.1 HupE/UreJ family protein [Halomonas sp. DP5N14-9]MBY6111290.1 HupE/UreJ family protein [Halomonas sp. DP1Y21-3]MCJ8287564.1 HupE/UreJ family protein [Halomonas sp.]MCO7215494.1 HupE/UreJ family protein [Halomonas sp. OfavH-34-E]NQY72284.1 HupE/UreJ family protein [Halomonas sp.]